MTCADGNDDHDLTVPAGVLGPYPVWGCSRCNAFAVYAVEGERPPADSILAALARAGCDPRPTTEGTAE